ncbi:MAG: hypothetical protein ACREEL_07595 [Stellaceae bacterium]
MLAALLIAAAGLTLRGELMKHLAPAGGDAPRYLRVASDLVVTGRYTDGLGNPDRAKRPPGMFMAPLYPAFVAAVIPFSPQLAATAACYAEGNSPCPEMLGPLIPLQFVVAAITLLLLWRLAATTTESEATGWIALVLAAFGSYEFASAALTAVTENLTLCLFTASQLALVAAARRDDRRLALLAGLFLGLTALTRPAFAYAAYAVLVVTLIGWLIPTLRRRHRPMLGLGAAMTAGAALALVPWMTRNALELGVFNLTQGYGGKILAQRVAYDAMSWHEYLAGWFYYLPDFGTSLARALFPPDWYARLGWNPGSYYDYSVRTLDPQTAAAAGGAQHQIGYLIRHYVLPDLPKFAAVTALLAWRGLWIGKYFGFIAFPLFVAAVAAAPLRRRAGRLLLLSLPALFMLAFQAAISVSMNRYNIDLSASFAIGAAVCFAALYERIAGRPGALTRAGVHPHI